jgi:hypothetical protein
VRQLRLTQAGIWLVGYFCASQHIGRLADIPQFDPDHQKSELIIEL